MLFLRQILVPKKLNLDHLCCPCVENSIFEDYLSCNRPIPHYHSRNPCALKKSKVFYDWLKNEQQREISGKGDIPIAKSKALCVDDSRAWSYIFISKKTAYWLQRPNCLGKDQIKTSEEELSTLKKFFPVINQFVYSRDPSLPESLASNRGVYLPEPVLVPKRQGWIQMDLSSSEMTDDIRAIVKEDTVEKTMLYEKIANYVQENWHVMKFYFKSFFFVFHKFHLQREKSDTVCRINRFWNVRHNSSSRWAWCNKTNRVCL